MTNRYTVGFSKLTQEKFDGYFHRDGLELLKKLNAE